VGSICPLTSPIDQNVAKSLTIGRENPVTASGTARGGGTRSESGAGPGRWRPGWRRRPVRRCAGRAGSGSDVGGDGRAPARRGRGLDVPADDDVVVLRDVVAAAVPHTAASPECGSERAEGFFFRPSTNPAVRRTPPRRKDSATRAASGSGTPGRPTVGLECLGHRPPDSCGRRPRTDSPP